MLQQNTPFRSHGRLGLLSLLSLLSLAGLLVLLGFGSVPLQAQDGAPSTAAPAAPTTGGSGAIVQQAIDQLKTGDIDAAVATLEPIRQDPNVLPQQLSLLGALYIRIGRPEDALKILAPLTADPEADPAVLFNAGRAALSVGDAERAEQLYIRSIDKAGMSPAVRDLGMLYAVRNNAVEAYKLLLPWSRRNPDDQEARLAAAFVSLQLERLPDAEEMLSDLPQDQPRVRLLWSQLLLNQGEPFGALSTLEPLLENPPAEIERDVLRTGADIYILTGESESAVKLLDGKIGEDPNLALLLTSAAYQSGDSAKAIATLKPFAERLLERPELASTLSATIASEYGRLLVTDGRQEEALPWLRHATENDAENKQAWQLLGQALAALGQRDKAKVALDRFVELSESEVPDAAREMQLGAEVEDPTGRSIRKALEAMARDNNDEALAILREEIGLSPGDPRPRLLEARLLVIMEKPEEALAAAEKILVDFPGSADGYYQRGLAKMATEDREGARADLTRAIEIAPEHTAAMNDLAVMLILNNERDSARALLERVLEIRPDDELANANLARLAGNTANAEGS